MLLIVPIGGWVIVPIGGWIIVPIGAVVLVEQLVSIGADHDRVRA